jgi:hypothetical protein
MAGLIFGVPSHHLEGPTPSKISGFLQLQAEMERSGGSGGMKMAKRSHWPYFSGEDSLASNKVGAFLP